MKYTFTEVETKYGKSPPARVVWIEISIIGGITPSIRVATREGGVD